MANPSRIFVCQADSVEFIDSRTPSNATIGQSHAFTRVEDRPQKMATGERLAEYVRSRYPNEARTSARREQIDQNQQRIVCGNEMTTDNS